MAGQNSEHPAWDILEDITEEMDLVYRATDYPWRLRIHQKSYDILLAPSGLAGRSIIWQYNLIG